MRLRLEADHDELVQKADQLLHQLGETLEPFNPELAEALHKALPHKKPNLRYKVLQHIEGITQKEYEKTLEAMNKDIAQVINKAVRRAALQKAFGNEVTVYLNRSLEDEVKGGKIEDVQKAFTEPPEPKDPDEEEDKLEPGDVDVETGEVVPEPPTEEEQKEAKEEKELEKAGPFIGPKGGKWADAKHTIPWKLRSGVLKIPGKEIREAADKLVATMPVDPNFPKHLKADLEQAESNWASLKVPGRDPIRVEWRVSGVHEMTGAYSPNRNEMTINFPDGLSMPPAVMAKYAREVLSHELTHALDHPANVEASQFANTRMRLELEGSEKDYYNSPSEVNAFSQMIYRELNDTLAADKFHKLTSILKGPEHFARLVSPTYKRILPWMNSKNKKRILKIVANVYSNLKTGAAEPIEKALLYGDSGPYDHTKPMVDKEEQKYEDVQAIVKQMGPYTDQDFDDKDGRFYGYSVNQLLDWIREQKQ